MIDSTILFHIRTTSQNNLFSSSLFRPRANSRLSPLLIPSNPAHCDALLIHLLNPTASNIFIYLILWSLRTTNPFDSIRTVLPALKVLDANQRLYLRSNSERNVIEFPSRSALPISTRANYRGREGTAPGDKLNWSNKNSGQTFLCCSFQSRVKEETRLVAF